MSVHAVIPWNFVSMTNDAKKIEVEGNTVGECLNYLIEKHPSLKADLFNRDGRLHHDIVIYLNKASTYPDQLGKTVSDGDELSISVLIGGG